MKYSAFEILIKFILEELFKGDLKCYITYFPIFHESPG